MRTMTNTTKLTDSTGAAYEVVAYDPAKKIAMIIFPAGADLRPWNAQICESIQKTGEMPTELRGEFTVTHIEISGERRARIDWR